MFENSFVVVGTITAVDRTAEGVRIAIAGPGPIKSAACVEIRDAEMAAIVMDPNRGFRRQDVISARGHLQLDPRTQQNIAIVARGGVSRISRAAVAAVDQPTLNTPAKNLPESAQTNLPAAATGSRVAVSGQDGGADAMFGGSAPAPTQASQPATLTNRRPEPLPAGFPQDLDKEWPDLPF